MSDRFAASGFPDDGMPDARADPEAPLPAPPALPDDATELSDRTLLSPRSKPVAPDTVPDDDPDRTHLADRTFLSTGRARGGATSERPALRRSPAEPIPDAAPVRYAPRSVPSPSDPPQQRTASGGLRPPSGGPVPDAALVAARRRRRRVRLLAGLAVGAAALVLVAGILIVVLVKAF